MPYYLSVYSGISKIKSRITIALTILGLLVGSGGLSLAFLGSASAVTPPTPAVWEINSPAALTFVCGGSDYAHTLNTVSENKDTGNFTGTGSYNADSSYTWNMSGNTNANNITFTVVYTGADSGYTLNGTGTINSDGSISGTVDNNCQTFFMPAGSATAYCQPTGFDRDGINMTAAIINPSGTVSGNVNATNCNVGVYYSPGHNGLVKDANVFGSNYFGIVVQRAKVDVKDSSVHNIGEVPFNGAQQGIGIYYATVAGVTNTDCTSGSTAGTVEDNSVSAYQKAGIVGACTGTNINVQDNTVKGNGPVNYIAQNGIEIDYGATGTVASNQVSGNSYTGNNYASSGGILVFGGCYGYPTSTADIHDNDLTNNDVGIFAVNYDNSTNCTGVTTAPTNVKINDNVIRNSSINNVSGLCDGSTSCGGQLIGYQAGIEDVGDSDTICNNVIGGPGYAWQGMYNYSSTPSVFTQTGTKSVFVRPIDAGASFPTTNVKVCKNNQLLYSNYPEISGNVNYTAYGVYRHAKFYMESADNQGTFKYSDTTGAWYDVKVEDVKVSGNTGYFAGVVTKASNSSWVGNWLFAEINDNHPEKIWGSFTDQTTAQVGVKNMTNPADGPFTVTKGTLSIIH